ncbi:MAG TPA: HEAT repeat domain-containing protein [Vicinamibacterales bacterium]|nr:HEAT repeat domain-containing protein [Vicinamibacterales bacterium]
MHTSTSTWLALRRTRTACAAGLLVATALSPGAAAAGAGQVPADAVTFRQLSADVNSAEPKVRRAALKTLATMGPEALDPISLLVADPIRDIRHDAIQAVVGIYVEPPPKRRVSSPEDAFEWSPYLTTPWAVPSVLTTNLVRALADDWPSERRDAAYALGVVLSPPIDARVADELTYSLSDPASEVRLAAVRVLGRLQAARAGDQLIGRIVDSDLAVRLAAMRAVGELREARALVALRQQIDYYGSATAGRAALDALARIAHPSTAGLIEQERFSHNGENRRIAYEGIARLGGVRDADASSVEQKLTEERDNEVRLAMAFALAAAGRPYVERVVQAVAEPPLADQAMGYLVELGRIQPDALVPHLQDRDPVIRARVATATGLVGGQLAESELTRLTTDGDPTVRRAAEAAMLRLRTVSKKPGTAR